MSPENYCNIERRGEINYAKPLARALLRDGRLSFGARGFFSFLWDLPANWQPRPSHLVRMSGAGKDALMSLRRELEKVSALAIEPIRLTIADAEKMNANEPGRKHKYRAGQVVGSRWVLFSPHLWAIEMPLDGDANSLETLTKKRNYRLTEKPSLGLSVNRKNRPPKNPPQRFFKGEGSPKVKQQQEEGGDAAAPPPQSRKERGFEIVAGVKCWRSEPDDARQIEALAEKHGEEQVAGIAAEEERRLGRLPLRSEVVAIFARQMRDQLAVERAAEDAEAKKKNEKAKDRKSSKDVIAALARFDDVGDEDRDLLVREFLRTPIGKATVTRSKLDASRIDEAQMRSNVILRKSFGGFLVSKI